MAANTEIVAILNSGISFRRLLYPYLVSATVLATLLIYFNGWVIPHSNKVKLDFENVYIKNPVSFNQRNIHRQLVAGTFVYMESYNNAENIGYRFSMEKIVNGKRTWFLNSDRIKWDSTSSRWHIEQFYIRTINGYRETLRSGWQMDTLLDMHPSDFRRRANIIDAMDNPTLSKFIEEERTEGSVNINPYLVEKYRRYALPFSTFILTLIGVSLSSRKSRGGIGTQLGVGITLSFSYILFMQVFNTFAASGSIPPFIAVWIPNFIYACIAAYLVKLAPK
jgi:lipopolysaccharide export system permease protein